MKIYDVVFYYNEPKVLDLRLEYLKDYVHETIIYNFGENELKLDNVKVINVGTSWETFKEKNFCFDLLDFIGKKNISYDDVFIFSKSFEIPCEKCFESLKNEYTGGFQNTAQTVYEFDSSFKSIYKSNGTIFTKMMDLMSSDISHNFILNKKEIPFSPEDFWFCGFSLFSFDSIINDKKSLDFWFPNLFQELTLGDLESLRSNKVNLFSNQKKHKLIPTESCPIKFERTVSHEKVKKVLITTLEDHIDDNEYDEIFYLSYENFGVKKPKSVFYSSKNYYEDFLINQSLVFLKELFLNPQDLIFLKTKTEELPSVFTYDHFKSSIPSELT